MASAKVRFINALNNNNNNNVVIIWLRSVRLFGAPQQISTGFASWLLYSSDVAHRRLTKLYMMFGHLLRCYTICTFSGALAHWPNFAGCKIHFTSKSCVLLYWQHYCTAVQHRASAKLRLGTRNGITEVSQRVHLYSAGWPSCGASAHILVVVRLQILIIFHIYCKNTKNFLFP